MNKLIAISLFCLATICMRAQSNNGPFRTYIYNNEFDVFLRINFYDQNINVPGQDLLGQVPGYLGKKNNSFVWVITSATIKGNKAHLALINDYGSEDLTATLTRKNDSIYVLKQEDGSTLKVPNKGKWQKLPKTLEFKRK
ncbi:hypothetical protein [Xylanibacter ruminicola]|uniref:Uncharacterized protein n=1 Tax=Xylanibacter ruminicola TaxID=839 RepID=A0A1M6WBW0_XYLRU|nr:hypothetical protein [Xylanibacter ruminicola]SHK90965.1 hypothetical protein SAMN05216463_1167 [Xylanibacter ruminicola]